MYQWIQWQRMQFIGKNLNRICVTIHYQLQTETNRNPLFCRWWSIVRFWGQDWNEKNIVVDVVKAGMLSEIIITNNRVGLQSLYVLEGADQGIRLWFDVAVGKRMTSWQRNGPSTTYTYSREEEGTHFLNLITWWLLTLFKEKAIMLRASIIIEISDEPAPMIVPWNT